jgi:hypothetical protein
MSNIRQIFVKFGLRYVFEISARAFFMLLFEFNDRTQRCQCIR